jgi:hypothetical protein
VEVISNVNAQRSAVRSIAWLDPILIVWWLNASNEVQLIHRKDEEQDGCSEYDLAVARVLPCILLGSPGELRRRLTRNLRIVFGHLWRGAHMLVCLIGVSELRLAESMKEKSDH